MFQRGRASSKVHLLYVEGEVACGNKYGFMGSDKCPGALARDVED